jgi:hypothetical protein
VRRCGGAEVRRTPVQLPKLLVGQLPKVLAAAKCLPKVLAPKHSGRDNIECPTCAGRRLRWGNFLSCALFPPLFRQNEKAGESLEGGGGSALHRILVSMGGHFFTQICIYGQYKRGTVCTIRKPLLLGF